MVAREYGKPCVAGIQENTTILQDGQLVEVEGAAATFYLDQADERRHPIRERESRGDCL